MLERSNLMYLVKSPNYQLPPNTIKVFLAGCMEPQWRNQFIKDLSSQNIVLIDPTNEDYKTQSFDDYKAHCYWELDMQNLSDIIVVWLDENSVAPISLFEIGISCGKGQAGDKVVLGVDKKYPKRKDLLVRWSYFFNKVAETPDELFEDLNERILLKKTIDESLSS